MLVKESCWQKKWFSFKIVVVSLPVKLWTNRFCLVIVHLLHDGEGGEDKNAQTTLVCDGLGVYNIMGQALIAGQNTLC